MPETRRQYDPEFKAGAVRIVYETRRSVAEVAEYIKDHQDLDIIAAVPTNKDVRSPASTPLHLQVYDSQTGWWHENELDEARLVWS